MMRRSKLLQKSRAGQPVYFAQMGYVVPPLIAYTAHEGYDAIWLDLEHHAMDDRELQAIMAFCHYYDIDCIIRPPTKEKGRLYRYLEDGAAGLMIPHVHTADDVRAIVDKVRFPPLGDRGMEGFGFEANFGLDVGTLATESNGETALIIQIETPEAVQHVAEIAAVEGIDGLFIGPADFGLRNQYLPPQDQLDIHAVMEKVAIAAEANSLVWGSYAVAAETIEAQFAMGAKLLVWGQDFLLLKEGFSRCRADLDRITAKP